jgi:hypothetical protein
MLELIIIDLVYIAAGFLIGWGTRSRFIKPSPPDSTFKIVCAGFKNIPDVDGGISQYHYTYLAIGATPEEAQEKLTKALAADKDFTPDKYAQSI